MATDTIHDIKFRFNPSSSKSRKVLGPLEGEIMEVVWEQGPTTVNAVHKALRAHKEIAYTTIMTTMSRLAKKHLLYQDTSTTSYVYSPVLSRSEFELYVITGIIRGLYEDFGEVVIDCFVDFVKDRGEPSVDHLRRAICAKW